MEYQDWYERYQNAPPSGGYYRGPGARRERRGVSFGALVACLLVAALLGGVGGSYLTAHLSTGDSAQSQQAAIDAAVRSAVTEAVTELETAAAQLNGAGASGATLQSASAGGYSKAQIIELCAASVVGIDVTYPASGYGYYWGGQQTTTGSGSGIIVTNDGYIVTCKHVVDGAASIKVILNDDTEHNATLVGSDGRNDLAVIKIEAANLSPCTLGDSDMLTVGEDVVAIGNPLGELRGTATGGMVSALNRKVNVENAQMTLLQTDAAISPGNSGGGLFSASGTLIGIVNAKASSQNAEGLGFAIPVNSVKQIISDLMDLGYVRGRAYLGVATQNVTLQSSDGWGGFFGSFYGMGGVACVRVEQVVSGSTADRAGIKPGDLILSVGEQTITSGDDLSRAINAYNAGDTATILIQRDGEQQQVPVTFSEYTPGS